MEQTIAGIASSYGAKHEIRWTPGYVNGDNHPDVCAVARQVIANTLGQGALREIEHPLFGGEDFSSYQQVVPGCFLFIGSGNEAIGATYNVHHPRFKLDEEVLQIGVKLHVGFIRHLLINQD
ncbi:metal-dependent amidase/aminoacylase/carboxypeptidase family protein [Ewingella americana]